MEKKWKKRIEANLSRGFISHGKCKRQQREDRIGKGGWSLSPLNQKVVSVLHFRWQGSLFILQFKGRAVSWQGPHCVAVGKTVLMGLPQCSQVAPVGAHEEALCCKKRF